MMEAEAQTVAREDSGHILNYTTRFGEVELHEDRLISFPLGVLGFEDCTVFGLSTLPEADDSPLMLLQCVNEPQVSFLVADPKLLGLSFKPEDLKQALRETGMASEDCQFLVILTLYDQGESYYLTANMKAPVMVDTANRTARQHILTNKDYSTQHKI
tara:strand:+ start:71 stop:544 length:474 start_codon:yes stop_codon:yes gene_type:complete